MVTRRNEGRTEGKGFEPRNRGVYEPPRLVVLGSIEEMTKGGEAPTEADVLWNDSQ